MTEETHETAGQMLARIGADAQLWAKEFIRRFVGSCVGDAVRLDEELMIGWFANAIEAGRDAGRSVISTEFGPIRGKALRITRLEPDDDAVPDLPALTIRIFPADAVSPSLTAEWAVTDPLIVDDMPQVAAGLYAAVDATRRAGVQAAAERRRARTDAFEQRRAESPRLGDERAAELVFQALGAASMCWESPESAGVFRSEQAVVVGRELLTQLGYQDATREHMRGWADGRENHEGEAVDHAAAEIVEDPA